LTCPALPDGKYLAYVDLKGMHLQVVDTGETRAIPMPDELSNRKVGFECITWSPDSIHFLCNSYPTLGDRFHVTENDHVSIWEFSVNGGKRRMLRDMTIACCFSPDGSQIAFGTNSTPEVWVIDSNRAHAHKVLKSATIIACLRRRGLRIAGDSSIAAKGDQPFSTY
jgi:WD40 repeat protein